MATFAITGNTNMDALTAKGGADTYNVNGGTLTQDRDTRNGVNPSNSHGNINGSATLGGTIKFRSDKIRWIYFTGGSGNVPAYETVISQAAAGSGLLIGVHASTNSPPITPGTAMPATGYIRVTQWNSLAYAAGALTGITATCAADPVFGTFDRVGWMIAVGRDSTNTNISRLNNPNDDVFLGDWFLVGITDGVRATAYQIPGNGNAMYFGGVEVETAPGSGVYEWWPVTTSTMTAYNLRTTGEASKQCWVDPANAQVRFGHDGTNSTGGACPASGCKVRIPNLFLQGCTAGAPTVNSFSAIASRHYFYANGAGRWRMTGVSSAWRQNLVSNAYEVYAKDSSFCQTLTISSNATPYELDNICVSTPVDDGVANSGLVLSSSFIGGTVVDSTVSVGKIDSVNKSSLSITSSSNGSFDNCKFLYSGMPTTSPSSVISSIGDNFNFQNCYFIGRQTHSQSVDFTAQDCISGGVTSGAVFESNSGMAFISLSNKCSGFLFEDWTFPEDECLGKSTFITLSGSSSDNKFRNMGDAADPISSRTAIQYDLPWTRSGSVITITWNGHPVRTNDYIKTLFSTSAAAVGSGGLELATYIGVNTFSIVGAASGDASGTVTLMRVEASEVLNIAAGCSNNEFQNIFVDGVYSNTINAASNGNGNTYLNIFGGIGASNTYAGNDMTVRGVSGNASTPSATSAQYGHTFADGQVQTSPNASGGIADGYVRNGAVAVITHVDHGIEVGNTRIRFYAPSDTSTFLPTVAWKLATPLTKDTFSVPVVNAGSPTGTVSWDAPTDKLTLYMNEESDTIQRYTIDSGTPAFTGAGALSAVAVGDQITWEMPEFLINYTGFADMPIETSLAESLASQGAFRFMYDIAVDDGAFSGSYKNLSLILTQTSGVSGTPTMTFASTANIQAGDKITGAHIPRGAYVVSVDSGTQITISANLLGTATGDYMFNHLPNETFTTNFKLKVRQITLTANALSNTYINIPLTSDATSRADVYPIVAVLPTFELTELPNNTTIVAVDRDTEAELDRQVFTTEDTYQYLYSYAGVPVNARFLVWNEDYIIQIYDVELAAENQSFPVSLVDDNVYITERDYSDMTIDYDDTLITLESGVVRLNVPEVYSRWKDDVLVDSNILYPLAFRVSGGQLLNGSVYSPKVAYLQKSDGWQIKPDEVDHTLNVTDGFLYTDDETDPFADTLGAYTVRINYQQPNAALAIDTGGGGGGSTPADIWSYGGRTLTGIGSSGIASQSSVDDIPTASENAVAVESQLADDFGALPTAAENATAVQAQLDDDFAAIPTAAENATAVATELDTDLTAILSNTDATQAKIDQL